MKLILASKSPRRIAYLQPIVKDLVIDPSDIDEKIDIKGNGPIEVMSVAFEKARSVSKRHEEGVVLGVDTVVYLDEIIGKPKDLEDAFHIIKKLSGKTHEVLSGIALIDSASKRARVDFERTLVTFREISDEEIDRYVHTAAVLDKAGAYAIQEEARDFVTEVKGPIDNVIGFPSEKIFRLLEEVTHEKNSTL
ncbi:Maf family protein [Guggenheimella bovis]